MYYLELNFTQGVAPVTVGLEAEEEVDAWLDKLVPGSVGVLSGLPVVTTRGKGFGVINLALLATVQLIQDEEITAIQNWRAHEDQILEQLGRKRDT